MYSNNWQTNKSIDKCGINYAICIFNSASCIGDIRVFKSRSALMLRIELWQRY